MARMPSTSTFDTALFHQSERRVVGLRRPATLETRPTSRSCSLTLEPRLFHHHPDPSPAPFTTFRTPLCLRAPLTPPIRRSNPTHATRFVPTGEVYFDSHRPRPSVTEAESEASVAASACARSRGARGMQCRSQQEAHPFSPRHGCGITPPRVRRFRSRDGDHQWRLDEKHSDEAQRHENGWLSPAPQGWLSHRDHPLHRAQP